MVGAPRRFCRVFVALVQGTGGLLALFGAAVWLGGPGPAQAGTGSQSATGPAEQMTSPSPPPASPSTTESSRWPSSAPQPDTTSEAGAASQPDTAELARQRQLQVFGPILLNPSRDIDAVTRRNAAQELLNMRSADASALLKDALVSRKPVVMLAALEALHTAPVEALAEFQESCMKAIANSPPETVDALAIAFSRMGDGARYGLAVMALDTNLSDGARLGPIAALAYFRDRVAAGHLISLLSPRSIDLPTPGQRLPQSPIITDAACASLQRLTGIPLGSQHDHWRRWWMVAKDLPPDQWFQAMAESLGDRVAELEARLRKSQETADALSKQVFETYRELYPALPVEEQLRRLPRLLDDPSPPVRLFALSRVNLLLRDSVRISAELQQKLADRMEDDVPELRAETCRLLDELNYEGLLMLVEAHLQTEHSPVAASALLEVARKRPDAALLGPCRAWLNAPGASDEAANAVWAILIAGDVDETAMAETRGALPHATPVQLTASQLRVLAYIGDEQDAPALEAALDGDDLARKIAVAEGMSQRGLRQRLIDRADDPAIYPFAVRALAMGPADLDSMRVIISLRPPDDQRAVWAQAIEQAAGTLPVDSLIEVDDLLVDTSWADAALRREVLMRGAEPANPPPGNGIRTEVLRRLAGLMIQLGDCAQAYELLRAANGTATNESLNEVRFQAAALSGHYDEAVQMQGDPAAWIALAQTLAARNPQGAAVLRDEINRRFGDELTQQQRGDLERISGNLDGKTTASANAPGHKSRP